MGPSKFHSLLEVEAFIKIDKNSYKTNHLKLLKFFLAFSLKIFTSFARKLNLKYIEPNCYCITCFREWLKQYYLKNPV